MQVHPYLFFSGRCDEAIAFYRQALGAEVTMLMRFKDNPEPHAPGALPPGSENKVMHATLRIGETRVNVADGHCEGPLGFQAFFAVDHGVERGRGGEAVRCPGRRREGGDAVGEDLLFPAVRDARGSLWGGVDDLRGGVRAVARNTLPY